MATTKKKTTKKVTPVHRTSVAKNITEKTVSESYSGYSVRVNRKLVALVVGLFLLAGLAYYYRSLFVVATVNGVPLTRIGFVNELEKQYGKQTLNSIVTKTLILQEAKKKNVSISDAELSAELKKIEDSYTKQGQKLDDLLKQQAMSREDFKERIKIQKLIEKLLEKDIIVTDKEVNEYMEKNKELFPEGTDQKVTKDNITQQLKQQKLGDKFQAWIQNLEKNAKINYYLKY